MLRIRETKKLLEFNTKDELWSFLCVCVCKIQSITVETIMVGFDKQEEMDNIPYTN